ncbi:MAG: CHAT domain-containing protein [Chitinophagales bacterium]|nr:CHAT domain-containing protein [Chitinophagales bacterium]
MKIKYPICLVSLLLIPLFFSFLEMGEGKQPDDFNQYHNKAAAFLDSTKQASVDTIQWCEALEDAAVDIFETNYWQFSKEDYLQAVAYYKLSLPLRSAVQARAPHNKDNLEQTIKTYTNLANFSLERGAFNAGNVYIKACLDSIESYRSNNFYPDAFRNGRAFHVKARIAEELEGTQKADSAYALAIACYNDKEHTNRVSWKLLKDEIKLYNDRAVLWISWQKYDRALSYLDTAMQKIAELNTLKIADSIFSKKTLVVEEELKNVLFNISNAEQFSGDNKKSNHRFNVIRYLHNSSMGSTNTSVRKGLLSDVLKNYEYNDSSYKDTVLYLKKVTHELVEVNIAQSVALIKMKKWEEAEKLLNLAKGFCDKQKEPYYNVICKGMCLHNLGELNMRQGNHESNIALQDAAIRLLNQSTLAGDISQSTQLLECYHIRGLSLQAQQDIEAAKNNYRLAFNIIKRLEGRIQDRKSRLELRKVSQKIFDGAIQTHAAANDVDSAFFYAERSKSFNMLQAIRQQHLEKIRQVSEVSLERMQELENDIRIKRENLLWGIGVSKNLADIKKLEKERNLLEAELMDIPAYRKAYSTEVISVGEVKRELLGDQYAMIEYHVGDSVTFAFLLQEDVTEVFTIPVGREEIRVLEQKMYQGIYERKSSSVEARGRNTGSRGSKAIYGKAKMKALKANYVEAGTSLYDLLFSPFDALLKTEQIIIIPDDALTLIPFGALLTDKPKDWLLDTPGQPYLIEQYIISYGHSATLLKEVKDMPAIKSSALAMFTPFFGGSKDNNINTPEGIPLTELSLNDTIESLLDGEERVHIMGSDAQKERFVTELTVHDSSTVNNRFSHACLWGHGVMSDQNPGGSYVCFAQKGTKFDQSQTLTEKELYQLRIPLDLLILFACQTNWGEVQVGEGAKSFCRGLNFAGVRNYIAPLYAIPVHKSTLAIMQGVLEYLPGDNVNYARILTQAQREVIKNSNADPYFWAAFTYYGYPGTLEKWGNWEQYLYWGILFLALTLVALLLFLAKKRFF